MESQAEIIYINGALYSGEVCTSYAQAMAIANGKILALGSNHEVLAHAGQQTEVVDLTGKMLLPGFTDGHVHPLEGQQIVGDFDLSGISAPLHIIERIRACARATAGDGWVQLGGLNFALFEAYLDCQQLDLIVPDRALILIGNDIHSGCLNSRGLALAAISADTPDPAGGIYERAADGAPTGVIHEAALYKVFKLIPQLGPAGYEKSLHSAQTMAHRLGITGWFDAKVDEAMLKTYAQMQRSGELNVYVSTGLLALPHLEPEAQIQRFIQWRQQYETDNLRVHTVKIFIDGVTESQTAALLEPYQGSAEQGLLLWQQEPLNQIARLADAAGFDLHFHTVGDRAVRMALDALESVRQTLGVRDRRAQLAHLQLVDAHDMPRFRPLGAIASVQTLWTAASQEQQQLYNKLLGPERVARNYPFRSLRNAGAMLAGGSDWSVSTMNPLAIMQTGVSHVEIEQPGTAAWNPDERLDFQVMLEAHIVNSSYALRFDAFAGTLAVGKDASFTILDRNR